MIWKILVGILILLVLLLVVGLVRSYLNEPEFVVVAEPWSPETGFVETRSGRVHIYDQGPRDAPVYLHFHGSGRSLADVQEALAPLLAQNFRVIAIDHYGFGLSDRGKGWSYGTFLWAEQGIDVLDALGIDAPVMVSGHSAGAISAGIFAAHNPERTRGVVLLSTGIAIAPVQIPMLLPGVGEVAISGPLPVIPHFSDNYEARMRHAYAMRGTRHAMMVFVRRMYSVDGLALMDGIYEAISAPVLQVHGTEDAEISVPAAHTVQGMLSHGRMHVIEGAGHDLHVYNAGEVAEVIVAFAAEIESGAP